MALRASFSFFFEFHVTEDFSAFQSSQGKTTAELFPLAADFFSCLAEQPAVTLGIYCPPGTRRQTHKGKISMADDEQMFYDLLRGIKEGSEEAARQFLDRYG